MSITKETATPSRENKIITNPVKAIRANCLDCMGGSSNEVKLCPVDYCPLYPFRFGKNPYRKKTEMTEEKKAHLAEMRKKAAEQAIKRET